jgi:dienelactone hydrolase
MPKMRSIHTLVAAVALSSLTDNASAQSRAALVAALGDLPHRRAPSVDTLERVRLDRGWRYRIRYLVEDSNPKFHTPPDIGFAYLLVPDAPSAGRLPAIVAIHQDGSHNFLGAREPVGLGGDEDQRFGLALFERGYVVICPDRFLHGERRRIPRPAELADRMDEADIAEQHWVGQLQLMGRNFVAKEVFDLMLATDLLKRHPRVDPARIGAIGHSAGGYVLAYFMLADERIRVGVSSCGVFELVDWFAEDAIRKRNVLSVIPGFARVGRTSDVVGRIAPRPFLMTRGMSEWGDGDAKQRADSRRHVDGTRLLETEARRYYRSAHAEHNLRAEYFTEGGGAHAFPLGMQAVAFRWLDRVLAPGSDSRRR